jgi:hypothetical protein
LTITNSQLKITKKRKGDDWFSLLIWQRRRSKKWMNGVCVRCRRTTTRTNGDGDGNGQRWWVTTETRVKEMNRKWVSCFGFAFPHMRVLLSRCWVVFFSFVCNAISLYKKKIKKILCGQGVSVPLLEHLSELSDTRCMRVIQMSDTGSRCVETKEKYNFFRIHLWVFQHVPYKCHTCIGHRHT